MIASIDPVCGMRVKSGAISTAYEGVVRNFCSGQCQQKFLAEPAAYLQPQVTAAGPVPKRGLLRMRVPASPYPSAVPRRSREELPVHEKPVLTTATGRPVCAVFQPSKRSTP